MIVLLLACGPLEDAPEDSGLVLDSAGEDTADSARDTAEADADGDGALPWSGSGDPALADCDDLDPEVNPSTELLVPAGAFTRGSPGELWAEPVTEVTLSAFCIDRVEVTHGDFLRYLQEQEDRGHSNEDDLGRPLYNIDDDETSPDVFPSRFTLDQGTWAVQADFADHPVTEVWEYAGEDYCAWRGKRLPTEAEWEKAARGTDARQFPWGDAEPTCAVADFAIRPPSAEQEAELCYGLTVPVDTLPENLSPYSVIGMAGNASEWVSDWFSPTAYESADLADPTGPSEGVPFDDGVGTYVARVSRGGNWAQGVALLRTFARVPEPEGGTSNGVSFRCVRPVD